jgi:hypothetical protein
MREPNDFATSVDGIFGSIALIGVNQVTAAIHNSISQQPVISQSFFGDDLHHLVDDVANWLLSFVGPSAGGSINYWVAAPEGMYNMFAMVAETLRVHQSQRRYVQYNYVPYLINGMFSYVNSEYNALRGWDWWTLSQAEIYASNLGNYLYHLIWSNQAAAYSYANQIGNMIAAYAKSLADNLQWEIVFDVHNLEALVSRVENDIVTLVNTTKSDLNRSIRLTALAAAAALAAALTFITTTFVPEALLAFKAEQTAEIAAGLDILWPLTAKSIDVAAALVAPTLPLVAARALDVPPEPIPGVGGGFEAVAAGESFLAALAANATAPMWNKLHKFADDTSELGGIIGTSIMAGLVTAFVLAPERSAAIVADTVAGPLNDAGVAVLKFIGLE